MTRSGHLRDTGVRFYQPRMEGAMWIRNRERRLKRKCDMGFGRRMRFSTKLTYARCANHGVRRTQFPERGAKLSPLTEPPKFRIQ